MGHSVSKSAWSEPTMTLLFDASGQRKYLTPLQRQEFLRAAGDAPDVISTFCSTLGYTGCRITEALSLTGNRVGRSAGLLLFESLKKRRRGIYRGVPVPPEFLDTLASVHDLGALGSARLWDWSRTTACRVKEVMEAAAISGVCASPKGVRHGFGIKR
jgi:integrase/recombinase XerD